MSTAPDLPDLPPCPLPASAGPIESVEPERISRLLNHGPTVLIGSADAGGRPNVMAAAWVMPLDFVPPKVAVVIDRSTWSRELIEASGHFSINVPCRAQADAVVQVGTRGGREALHQALPDKLAQTGLRWCDSGLAPATPLIEGCVAWLVCRVIPQPTVLQAHDLFLAEVLAAWADTRVFHDGRWFFDDPAHDALRTLHHVAGGAFFSPADGLIGRAAPTHGP